MRTGQKEKESKTRYSSIVQGLSNVDPILSIKIFLQRVMDDDQLSDSCWNSEMREVELWENERFGGRILFLVHKFSLY